MRLLLVDEDREYIEKLATGLAEHRYAVDIATDDEACNDFLFSFDYDLILLDSKLPTTNGATLCKQIRSAGHFIPLLMLSSKDDCAAKIAGLNAGADDYVVKPFDFEELLARIHALLRREKKALPSVLVWGDLKLDPNTFTASYENEPLSLTPKEFALLEQFLRHSDFVFSIDKIIESLWTFEDPPSEYAVRTHIKGLRQKLFAAGAPKDLVETVYGIGYRLKPLEVSGDPSNQLPAHTSALQCSPISDECLANLWEEFKPIVEKRLEVLGRLAKGVDGKGKIGDRSLLGQAKVEAHKLVGSLDSFGFHEGSNVARDIEGILTDETLPEYGERLASLLSALYQELKLSPPILKPSIEQSLKEGLLLMIVDGNPEFSQQLSSQAIALGMRTSIASTFEQVHDTLSQETPQVAVVHLLFDSSIVVKDDPLVTEQFELLSDLNQMIPNVPIVVLMEGGGFEQRLEVARRGGGIVLPFPTSPHRVIQAISSSIQSPGMGAKVMVVDSNLHFLNALRFNMATSGFNLLTVNDPEAIWTKLEDFKPDLLVLEAEMPTLNGLEVCQVLRSDLRWMQLPVVMLTARTDADFQSKIFEVGADDLVTKPVIPAQLVTRILNRIKRATMAAAV